MHLINVVRFNEDSGYEYVETRVVELNGALKDGPTITTSQHTINVVRAGAGEKKDKTINDGNE